MSQISNALVLSGGNAKGAFQAGAVEVLLDCGFVPDAIYGVSVGALNGAFIADRAGRARQQADAPVHWPTIGRELAAFWEVEVTGRDVFGKRRRRTRIGTGLALLGGRLDGLLDTTPLRALIDAHIDVDNVLRSPARLSVGVASLNDGQYLEVGARDSDFTEYLLASAAIPIVMPASRIGGAILVDGGIRNVAPLRAPINDGATNIVVIATHPEALDRLDATDFDPGDLRAVIERTLDVVLHGILENDLQRALWVNACIDACGHAPDGSSPTGKRRLNLTVIRPSEALQIRFDDFSSAHVADLLERGREQARAACRDPAVGPAQRLGA